MTPLEGKVQPGERAKISFVMRPAAPCNIAESFSVRIAHFEPVTVTCYCTGVFPSLVATLPRLKRAGPYGETSDVALAQATAASTALSLTR